MAASTQRGGGNGLGVRIATRAPGRGMRTRIGLGMPMPPSFIPYNFKAKVQLCCKPQVAADGVCGCKNIMGSTTCEAIIGSCPSCTYSSAPRRRAHATMSPLSIFHELPAHALQQLSAVQHARAHVDAQHGRRALHGLRLESQHAYLRAKKKRRAMRAATRCHAVASMLLST